MNKENTNQKTKSLSEKILIALLILLIVTSGMYFPKGKAEETNLSSSTPVVLSTIPSGIEVVTDEYEKEKLLGISNMDAVRRENLLGLASQFSIFAKEDVNFQNADVEGSVAAGGSITATTDYKFQIGWKNENDEKADIVVGDGPIENIALTFGADGEGNIIEDNKKVVVSTNATNINYDDFSEEELSKFVASDLINFDEEFEYYDKLSKYLMSKGIGYSGTVKAQTIGTLRTDYFSDIYCYEILEENDVHNKIYLKGENEYLNIFTLNPNFEYTPHDMDIVLDIPAGSYAIINAYRNKGYHIWYPLSKEEIANINPEKDKVAYVETLSEDTNKKELLKDENGNLKVFKKIINGDLNNNEADEYSRYILFNMPYTSNVDGHFPGSLLAPNSEVYTYGYFPGNLICKSYSGVAQFGYMGYDGPLSALEKYTINIEKIDSITNSKVEDAKLEILDLDRNSLYSWKSGEEIDIQLAPGEYILVEQSAGSNYEEVVNKESTFTVKGSLSYNEDKSITPIAFISMGAETTQTTYTKNSVEWKPTSYEYNDKTDIVFADIEIKKTIDLTNNEKAVIECGKTDSTGTYTITEYDSNGIEKNIYTITDAPIATHIVSAEKTNGGYLFYVYDNSFLTYSVNYNIASNTSTIVEIKNALNNISHITSNLFYNGNAIAKRSTTDNGCIIIGSSVVDFIPGEYTVSGEDIQCAPEIGNVFLILKINSDLKIEWANYFESDVSMKIDRLFEIEDGYVITGGSYGNNILIPESQNTLKYNVEINEEANTIGRTKPILLQIDNNGKINYYKYLKDSYIEENYGGVYKSFDNAKIIDGTIYTSASGNVGIFTKVDFPTSWNALYSSLNNVGIIEEISFEIDASNATTLTDKDVYMIVATNNGIPYEWIEYVCWSKVEDGQEIIANVPVIRNMYPFYTASDWENNATIPEYRAHFYRQNVEDSTDTATEVYDIDVKNIKAYYYTKTKTTTTYDSQEYVTTNEIADAIIIENDHIKTNITITKTDKDSGEAVANAIYGIYDSNDTLVLQSTTDTNGKIEFKDTLLDVGNYYIKEIAAPQGYKLSTEKTNFTITASGTFTFELEDEKTKVSIDKIDQDNRFLAGAELKIVDAQGTQVAKWTTTNSTKLLEGLAVGTYTLTETFTPTGYVKGNDITFKITDIGEIYVDGTKVEKISLKNTLVKGTINITKTGEVFSTLSIKDKISLYTEYAINYENANLSNVIFELYASEDIIENGTKIYSKDELITEKTTDEYGIATFENLPLGNYYAVEKQAKEGYVLDKTPITLGLAYANENTPIIYAASTMNNERIKATINVEKIKKGATEKIQGAVFGLYNTEEMFNNEIPKDTLLSILITNENGTGTFDIDLPLGNYYIKELEAPEGFIKSEEVQTIEFTTESLEASYGNAVVSTENYNLTFENDFTKVQITKTEINTETQISGATLELHDSDGNVIDTWQTDGTPHYIEKLPTGNYTIVETSPAPGYVTAQNKTITVTSTSDVQIFDMEDDFTKLQISKIEKDTQNNPIPVIGATLQLFDEQNNPVVNSNGENYSWVTTENPHTITKLPIGTYILREVETPAGYVTSPDITITIEDTSEQHVVIMEDDFTKVQLSKLDIETKEQISGALLQIVDEDGNVVLNKDGAPYKWLTTSEAKVINKLPIGRYKLVEVEPKPGFIKAADVSFEITNSGEVVNVVMEDDFTKLQIEKLDGNSKPLQGATLQILDENDIVVEEWETDGTIHEIRRKLEVGKTYKLVESQVPEGYIKAQDVEFNVTENGQIVVNEEAVEKITMVNNFMTGTIKITKTGEVLKGVKKYTETIGLDEFEAYEFEYEDGVLSGVVFELYAAEDIVLNGSVKYSKDEKIAEATTDDNGIATFENINLGSYYFVEKQTQEGYELDKKPVSLVLAYETEIDSDNVSLVYTTTFNNERIVPNFCINKIDATTKEVLENVQFGLFTKEEVKGLPADTLLSIAQTDENGIAYFDIDIPLGKYYIKEIKTIDGYVLSNEVKEVEFNSENSKFELTFENDYTKVKIKKLNEQGVYVQNAKLQIQDMDGKVIEQWTTTDTYHRIERKLTAGKTYKLVEVQAPQGYNIAEPIEFTVNEDGKINVIKMVDVEKLTDENIPQTGDMINCIYIALFVATICSFGYNLGKFVLIVREEKSKRK